MLRASREGQPHCRQSSSSSRRCFQKEAQIPRAQLPGQVTRPCQGTQRQQPPACDAGSALLPQGSGNHAANAAPVRHWGCHTQAMNQGLAVSTGWHCPRRATRALPAPVLQSPALVTNEQRFPGCPKSRRCKAEVPAAFAADSLAHPAWNQPCCQISGPAPRDIRGAQQVPSPAQSCGSCRARAENRGWSSCTRAAIGSPRARKCLNFVFPRSFHQETTELLALPSVFRA